jgi:hypothetical protein
MKNLIAVVVVAIALIAAGALYFWKSRTDPTPPIAQAPVEEGSVEAPPPASSDPQIRHPIPSIPQQVEPQPSPSLQESDESLRRSVTKLLSNVSLGDLVVSEDIARRVVATVDNLPRKKVAERILPIKRPAGQIVASDQGDGLTLSERNYARYTPYVALAQSVDVPRLVALYVRHYALFQQAYEELGYPNKYFNDRLIEAIDDLLFTPDAEQPVKLVQPKVLYEFADPALEDLSAGQKIMIRMGPQNAAVVTTKLREVRRELVTESPKPAH